MKLQSDFGILDVKHGQIDLTHHVRTGETVSVTIDAIITGPWGDNDGISQEFELEVRSVKECSSKNAG